MGRKKKKQNTQPEFMRLKVITFFFQSHLKEKTIKAAKSGQVASSGRFVGHYSATQQRLRVLCSNHVFTKSLKVVLGVPESEKRSCWLMNPRIPKHGYENDIQG